MNLNPISGSTDRLAATPEDLPKWEIGLGQIDVQKFQSLNRKSQNNLSSIFCYL